MSRGADDFETESVLSFGLGGVGWHVLGFDDYWGAAGRGDEYVGLETGAVDDLLGVLVANVVLGQHTAKQVAEGVVGVPLDLLGHWDGSWIGAVWIIQTVRLVQRLPAAGWRK